MLFAILAGFAGAQPPESLPPARPGLEAVAFPALDKLEQSVAEQIRAMQDAIVAQSESSGLADDDLTESYSTLGQIYHAYGFFDSAGSCYRNAASLAPRDFRWPHLLGQAELQAGRLEVAAPHFAAAKKLNPKYLASAIQLGNVYKQLNRPQQARAEFEAALALDPDSAAAHDGLAEAALAEKNYTEAIKHFEAALQAIPSANRIHYSLAMAYRGAGDLEKAREHLALRGTVGVRPADPLVDGLRDLLQGATVHLLRGRLAFNAGRFKEAADAFARAVEAAPRSASAHTNLGTALGKAGDTVHAKRRFLAALEIDPEDTTAHFNLAALLRREGEQAAAVAHLAPVLKKSPDDAEANREMARSLDALGRHDEASPFWAKTLELTSGDEVVLMEWVEAVVARGGYRQARDLLDAAYQRYPDRPRTTDALARILAASPDATVRDGTRALELAMKAYRATNLLAHAETVALALAQLARCDEAAEWQARSLAVAEKAGETALATQLAREFERYRRGSPCAP